MRVFFAIELEEGVKNYLSAIQKEIRLHSMAGNFTLSENFHLTLRFIGEQSVSQIEQLRAALNETASIAQPFELMLTRVGNFSKGNRKVIWVGVKKSQELETLYGRLESSLIKLGFAKETRGYNPHITLAREVKIENIEELESGTKVENIKIKVKSISLMESTRINNKLCYIPKYIAEFSNE